MIIFSFCNDILIYLTEYNRSYTTLLLGQIEKQSHTPHIAIPILCDLLSDPQHRYCRDQNAVYVQTQCRTKQCQTQCCLYVQTIDPCIQHITHTHTIFFLPFNKVLFPAPDAPISATRSPGSAEPETSSRISCMERER